MQKREDAKPTNSKMEPPVEIRSFLWCKSKEEI
jgi:hypothetical protein